MTKIKSGTGKTIKDQIIEVPLPLDGAAGRRVHIEVINGGVIVTFRNEAEHNRRWVYTDMQLFINDLFSDLGFIDPYSERVEVKAFEAGEEK